jgi:hypothetical protein
MASEGNVTVHHVIHNEDNNVKYSTEVQRRNIKDPTLMRYAEQLSSNRTSNSLKSSKLYGLASKRNAAVSELFCTHQGPQYL